jgi:hypothetical protein
MSLDLTDDEKRELVDERVCRIVAALHRPDPSADDEALITGFLADEWACLEVAARVLAPAFGLDALDDATIVRLQRAAHEVLKAECRWIRDGRGYPTEPRP